MHAEVGDKLHIHGRTVGIKERTAEVVDVRGADGEPPYLVRFPDGHESLLYPGSDCVVEPSHTP
jgi:hypothetical protein